MSEHLIPPELLEKNEKAVEMYKDCLKLGKERRNKIRIIVVGPKKSGKTCLVRKLLRQGIEDVNSTNGVEIHISKCKAQISDNKWTCEKGMILYQFRNLVLGLKLVFILLFCNLFFIILQK